MARIGVYTGSSESHEVCPYTACISNDTELEKLTKRLQIAMNTACEVPARSARMLPACPHAACVPAYSMPAVRPRLLDLQVKLV
jgi:hypothetical protein